MFYKKSHQHKTKIEFLVQELLDYSITNQSKSMFSFPFILVRNKDGSYRICIGYHALNKITIKDKFPIWPFVDQLLDELHQAKHFSKLNLKYDYNKIRIQEEDFPKIVSYTHEDLYEFFVMPFRLSNALTKFQVVMNNLFYLELKMFLLVIFYGILVYNKNWSLHLNHVETMSRLLEKNKLYANKLKCCFYRREI